MSRRTLVLVVALIAAAGATWFVVPHDWVTDFFEKAPPTLQTTNAAGRRGSYFLPASYASRPLPLLVALHGSGGDGAWMIRAFRKLAAEREFIIVAPDSRDPGGWEVGDHRGEVTADFEHVRACIAEVEAMPNVVVDTQRILVAGMSGGASSAAYYATNDSMFTAFAVLHGGVIPGSIGPHVDVRGWFSTGDDDGTRSPAHVREAADYVTRETRVMMEFRTFPGGHGLSADEARAVVDWWLR